MTVLPEWILVAKQRVEKRAKELPIPGLGDGNELIRSDVPRLIGLVGEMGEAIRDAAEVLQEHVEGESVLIERLWRLWKKYRWEEEDNG